MIAADSLITRDHDGVREILLIQRKNPPFQNMWAFPAGMVEDDETILEGAYRELEEETHLTGVDLTFFGIYDAPTRDPRGRTVSVIYTGHVQGDVEIRADDDAKEAAWFPIDKLPDMAFDHAQVISDYLKRHPTPSKIEPETLLDFLRQSTGLKEELRHSWLPSGRHESVAEHTWRAMLFAFVFAEQFPDINRDKLLRMLLIHDLPEVVAGDEAAWQKTDHEQVFKNEKAGLEKILSTLPKKLQNELTELWLEFEEGETPEALFCLAVDKLEAIIQHNEADLSTWNEKEFGFQFTHGKKYSDHHPLFRQLREAIDAWSKKKIDEER